MDKISRILPATNRVVIAESADAQPARPGAPAFGRPMGRNSLGDRITLSQKALEAKMTGEMPALEPDKLKTYKNNPESAKLKMIDKLNNDFFNAKAEVRGSGLTASEQALKSLEDTDDLDEKMASTPLSGVKDSPLSQLENLAPQES